ncbi:hypothetical protein CBF23_004455 [Marinomonas agarivorans]|nr:hypothetical protein CBF23_004455 [Marinomonas agarivorans]
MAQPDIEIYLLSCPTDRILDWLKQHFSIISQKQVDADLLQLTLANQHHQIDAQILEQAGGKRFTSVWINSDQTPWKTDIDCARNAFATLDCEVRCCHSGWQEDSDEDPDLWWRINKYEEGPFIWN